MARKVSINGKNSLPQKVFTAFPFYEAEPASSFSLFLRKSFPPLRLLRPGAASDFFTQGKKGGEGYLTRFYDRVHNEEEELIFRGKCV